MDLTEVYNGHCLKDYFYKARIKEVMIGYFWQ